MIGSISIVLLALVSSGLLARNGLDRLENADDIVIAAERMRADLTFLSAIEDAAEAGESYDPASFAEAQTSLGRNAERIADAVGDRQRDGFLADVAEYREVVEAATVGFDEGDDDDDTVEDFDERGEELFERLFDQIGAVAERADADADQARESAEGAIVFGSTAAVAIAAAAMLIESRRRSRRLRRTEAERSVERAHALLEHSSDHVHVIEPSGAISFSTPAAVRAFGRAPKSMDELLGALGPEARRRASQQLSLPAAERDRQFEIDAEVAGEAVTLEVFITDWTDGSGPDGTIVWARDVTGQAALRDRLHRQAREDDLTGLANRRALTEEIERVRRTATPSAPGIGLVLLDLDGFKDVNDRLGHPAGDQLLAIVAERLRRCVPQHFVARLGGDEFAVVVDGGDDDRLHRIAARMVRVLTEPFALGNDIVSIGVGVGMAVMPRDSAHEELFRRADLALYRSKQTRPRRPLTYSDDMSDAALLRTQLATQMEHDLVHGGFRFVYQPIVDVATLDIVGFETLARWHNELLGDVSPLDFIPVAESNGTILELGRRALVDACCQLQRWRSETNGRDLRISVNVSVVQLQEPVFLDHVREALTISELPATSLVIEVTESEVINSPAIVRDTLDMVRALGVSVAIDDFGVGYSSMGQLQHLPVDFLKLDRSFITPLHPDDVRQVSLVRALVDLGQALGIEVVAEGVEELHQLDALRSSRCGFAQGFLWATPLDADEAGRLLSTQPSWKLETAAS